MQFQYKAIKDNKVVIKKIEGKNILEVSQYLRANNYFPIWIKPVNEKRPHLLEFLFDRVTFDDIVDFTRQVAIILNAGLTLIDALEIIKKQVKKSSLRKVVEDIDVQLKAGNTFSFALKKYPKTFSNLYISLVKSGEASGKLGEILLKLSDNLEKEREFKGKLKGALIYPAIVIIAMFGVMFIMVTFVIPKLLNLYQEFNVTLPFATQILILISSFTTRLWPVIIAGFFGGFYLLRKYFTTKAGKYIFDTLILKIPVINNVIKVSTLVDTTRTLAILIGSGVSILDALNIINETTDNIIFQDAFKNVYKKVEKGQALGAALDEEGIFPPILVQMTQVGEQTGHLDDTLMKLSKYFEMESELATKALTTLIEPAILVFLGLAVGFLVMSVITPIYNLTSSFK